MQWCRSGATVASPICATPAFALFALPCADAVSALIATDGGTSATSPFGQDPAVNPTSVLYSEAAASNVSQYYNASAGSGEMSVFGFPRGFFSLAWPHMDPGFPVVFPVRLLPTFLLDFVGLHTMRMLLFALQVTSAAVLLAQALFVL